MATLLFSSGLLSTVFSAAAGTVEDPVPVAGVDCAVKISGTGRSLVADVDCAVKSSGTGRSPVADGTCLGSTGFVVTTGVSSTVLGASIDIVKM